MAELRGYGQVVVLDRKAGQLKVQYLGMPGWEWVDFDRVTPTSAPK